MEQVFNCGKTAVRWDEQLGWDVYATDDISKGTEIESSPFILFPRITSLADDLFEFLNIKGFLSEKEKYAENLKQNFKFKKPQQFYFKWAAPINLNGEVISYCVLPLGDSCIYNSSNSNNNISWSVREKTFLFKADKDIKKGESLFSFYGYYLDNLSNIYNCDAVFNLALDPNLNGLIKLWAIRFSSLSEHQSAQTNPSYAKLAQLLAIAKDGLTITKIIGLAPNGEEKSAFDLADSAPMSLIYNKIAEYRASVFPLIKIIFKFEDKIDNQIKSEQVIFKK